MTFALKTGACAAALMMTIAGSAHAGVTFVASGVGANGHATAASGTTTSSGDGAGTDSLIAPGDEEATALATAGVIGKKAAVLADSQAFEDAFASFVDAASGSVDFSGHTFADAVVPGATAAATNTGSSFFYTFSIDYKSWLIVDYDLSETALASQFYNAGSLYDVTTSTSFGLVGGLGAGQSSGTLSQLLDPGTYTLYLNTADGDDVMASGVASVSGSHEETYDFAISPAPEPGLWALMLTSVGLAGLRLRRRRGLTLAV